MFELVEFDEKYEFSNFNSNTVYLDLWLKNTAKRTNKLGDSVVYLLLDDIKNVKGYFSISPHTVINAKNIFSNNDRKGFSNLNGYLIGKLAIDIEIQNQGFGKYLLLQALKKIKFSMSQTGGAFVAVDSLNDEVKKFYLKYGFKESKRDSNFLYLTKADLFNVKEI